jgi:hypothetical protein
MITATLKRIRFLVSMDDCCVLKGQLYHPCANGPLTTTQAQDDAMAAQFAELSVSGGDPSAFMIFTTRSTNRQPVIFDTGASLAITPEKADFDGPLTVPKGDLRLGGMANGLKIEGMGPVTWTFSNGDAREMLSFEEWHTMFRKQRLDC